MALSTTPPRWRRDGLLLVHVWRPCSTDKNSGGCVVRACTTDRFRPSLRRNFCKNGLEPEVASSREATGKARAPRHERRFQRRCTACLSNSTAHGSRARVRFWFGRAGEGVVT
jgi:hypothetical protein